MPGPTPESLAKNNTEAGHQSAIFCHFAMPEQRAKWPYLDTLLFAVPNGGARGDDAKTRAIRGAALAREGVKAGTSDIIMLVPRAGMHGFVLELKKLGMRRRKAEQIKFIADAHMQGYAGCVAEGWQLAVQYLEEYLNQPE